VLDPQVVGPADAGTAWMIANASARARIALVDMIVLLVSKPEAASADRIGERFVYFRARIRTECAGYKSACPYDMHHSHRRHLLSSRLISTNVVAHISAGDLDLALDIRHPTSRHRDGWDALACSKAHLPM
jgi:hypothetical protein